MASVDVIVPTFRRHQILNEALYRFSLQTFRDFRVILVNDDPSNSLSELIKPWKARLNILLLEPGVNQYPAKARNCALTQADAELIALCDDDDCWHSHHLQSLVRWLSGNHLDMVCSSAEIVATQLLNGQRAAKEKRRFSFLPEHDFLRKWNTLPPSCLVYKRELHYRLGVFDEALPNYCDWDWGLRVMDSGAKMGLFPHVTVQIAYDLEGGNFSAVPESKARELQALSAKHHLGRLPSSNFWKMLDVLEVRERVVGEQSYGEAPRFSSHGAELSLSS